LNDFDRAWQHLEPAVSRGGEHTKESVLAVLQSGRAKLWSGDNSAIITSLWAPRATGLRVASVWLAGGNIDEIREIEPRMIEWGRANGATQARIYGRRGFLRAFPEFRELETVMARDL
jgi:hypothetical protein